MAEKFDITKEVYALDSDFADTRATIESSKNVTLKSKVDVDRSLKQLGIASIWTDRKDIINKAIATKSVTKAQGIKLLEALTE